MAISTSYAPKTPPQETLGKPRIVNDASAITLDIPEDGVALADDAPCFKPSPSPAQGMREYGEVADADDPSFNTY